MPYSTRHWLATFIGDIFNTGSSATQEHFSFGLRFAGIDAALQPSQANVDALVAPTSTFFASTALGIHVSHRLTRIKLAPIGTDGKYPPGEVARESAALNVAGGYSATPSWPSQCTLALSLTTAVPRGRAHIGRIYLPPMGVAIGADGSLSQATVTGMLVPCRTWINALNAILTDAEVTVMSEFGDQHQVTGLRLGRIVDTQRRRRRSLLESPSVTPIP